MTKTANVDFKSRYRKYFDLALMASLLLHGVAFVLVPGIDVDRSRTDRDEIEVVTIEKDFVIPPPPRVVRPPRIPVASLDEDVPDQQTVEDNDFLPGDRLVGPPPPPAAGDFYVFEKTPRPLRRVKPEYPRMAREAEIEGVVTLKVTIDERGRVLSASVLRSDSEILNRAALDAIRQWTFSPAEQSGKPVKATITIPLGFSLRR